MNKVFEDIGYIFVGILLLYNLFFAVYLIGWMSGMINIIGGISLFVTSAIVLMLDTQLEKYEGRDNQK